MSVSAFIVSVPEAQPRVGPLRLRFDASARLGVPAHITVLAPFMAPQRITDPVLRKIQAALEGFRPFAFSLTRVGRFPSTAYLAPDPAAPFIALTERLVARFPAFPPFSGEFPSIVPHLTVAHGSAFEAELAAAELEATMQAQGSIQSACRSVTLLENSSGRWQEMHVFALAPADG